MARYRVTDQPWFTRDGLVPVGTVVTLPDGHKAPAHWEPVEDAAPLTDDQLEALTAPEPAAPAEPVEQPKKGKGKRPSDASPL